MPLHWHHNECVGISNFRCLNNLLNSLFRCRSKKTWKLCVTGLCVDNSPVTSEFPAQRASKMEMFPFHDVIMSPRLSQILPFLGKEGFSKVSQGWYDFKVPQTMYVMDCRKKYLPLLFTLDWTGMFIPPSWCHQMGSFSMLLSLCQENPLIADRFPHAKGQ